MLFCWSKWLMPRLGLTLLVFATSVVFGEQFPSLPAPTGTHSVGKAAFSTDRGELLLLWYPAQSGGRAAPYASKGLLAEIEKAGYYDQTPETIRSWAEVKTHSSEEAKPVTERAALLVFLPGAGVLGFQYSAMAEEFATHGYVVGVLDYFSSQAPKRAYDPNDYAAMEKDMALAAVDALKTLSVRPQWRDRIRLDEVGVLGHSIGGAAAIAAARLDRRFRASADMDGAPFGDSKQGAVDPLLVLRSRPIYSDADLAKRGTTRADWDKKGQEARKAWTELESKSTGISITVLSVQGTGHFSFSDAPFVMPSTINRFGGKIIDPERGHRVITTCLLEFFDGHVRGVKPTKVSQKCSGFEEIVPGIPPALN
jgi:dienelactone hydrolase